MRQDKTIRMSSFQELYSKVEDQGFLLYALRQKKPLAAKAHNEANMKNGFSSATNKGCILYALF